MKTIKERSFSSFILNGALLRVWSYTMYACIYILHNPRVNFSLLCWAIQNSCLDWSMHKACQNHVLFFNSRAPLYKWQVGMARSSWFIDCWMRGRGWRLMRCRSMTITHPSTWHQPTDTMESLRSYLCTSQVCVIRQLHWVRNNLIC